MTFPCAAYVVVDGWAGRSRIRVTLVGETPKRFRARCEDEKAFAPRRMLLKGDIWLVPKRSVVVGDPNCR